MFRAQYLKSQSHILYLITFLFHLLNTYSSFLVSSRKSSFGLDKDLSTFRI